MGGNEIYFIGKRKTLNYWQPLFTMYIYYPACAHAQHLIKQSVCLSSVVCCPPFVSIKISNFQHLGESSVNKLCETVKKQLLSRS